MATRRRNNTKHHKMSKKEQKLWGKILFWLFIGWWVYLLKFLFWTVPKWIIKAVKNRKENADTIDINSYSVQSQQKPKRKITFQGFVAVSAIFIGGLAIIAIAINAVTSPSKARNVIAESSIESIAESSFESSADTSVDESSSEPSVIESSVEESKVEISIVENYIQPVPEPTLQTFSFVVNTHSGKFHSPYCSSAQNIKPENRLDITKSAYNVFDAVKMVEADGYTPRGNCGGH